MRLVVGLGNPGGKYSGTRHNVGFFVAEALQKVKGLNNLIVKKSDVFMNESGSFVKGLVEKYKLDLSDIYIVHDDLDVKLGEYKIQFGKGPKDHNGIKSVDDKLGTSSYWHVRVGIDNRPRDNRTLGEDFVLQNFSGEERRVLDKTIKAICKKLAT